jgi:hypothetical protein
LFKGIEPKIKVNVVKKEEEPPKEAIAPEAVTEAAVPEAGAELPKEPEA